MEMIFVDPEPSNADAAAVRLFRTLERKARASGKTEVIIALDQLAVLRGRDQMSEANAKLTAAIGILEASK
jgi:hypothetical protein